MRTERPEPDTAVEDGKAVLGPPKTSAGRRVVAVPAVLLRELEAHLAAFTEPEGDALVFTGAKGAPLRRSHWGLKWRVAARAVGLPDLHFHDLRHTGNTLAAAAGASTKELMARMGHASPRAALVYQHATRERDAAIATALNRVITSAVPERSAPVLPIRRKAAEKP